MAAAATRALCWGHPQNAQSNLLFLVSSGRDPGQTGATGWWQTPPTRRRPTCQVSSCGRARINQQGAGRADEESLVEETRHHPNLTGLQTPWLPVLALQRSPRQAPRPPLNMLWAAGDAEADIPMKQARAGGLCGTGDGRAFPAAAAASSTCTARLCTAWTGATLPAACACQRALLSNRCES